MLSKKLFSGAALTALTLAMGAQAFAQETTGALRGSVTDSEGAPIAGANVVVLHTPSGTRRSEATDASGVFDLRGLRVGGPYTIEFTADGHRGERVEGITIGIGDPFRITADLEPSENEIVVTATRYGLSGEVGTTTAMGRDDIAGVVSVQRDIRDMARRDPLVTQDVGGARGGGGQGGVSIAGSAPRSNRITVDGMQAGDDFGLVTNGLSTLRGPVSIDAVQEFSVQVVPFDVENGDFTGGALNMVLRQGTNDFGGTLFLNYLNDGMVGETLRGAPVPTIVRQENYGGFFGGPIIQDRLFFAASYEYYESADISTRGLAGEGFANVLAGFTGTGSVLTRADLNLGLAGYSNYAVSSRFAPGDFLRTAPISDEKWTTRIDWNITDDHTASLSYRTAESSLMIRDFPAQRGDMSTGWYAAADTEEVYTAQVNSTWSQNLSTEFRASFRNYERRQEPPGGQDFGAVQICFEQALGTIVGGNTICGNAADSSRTIVNFGADANRHANYLNTTNTQFAGSAEYQSGAHLFKVGGQFQGIEVDNLFVNGADGTFYFDTIDAFARGEMSRFQYTNTASGNAEDGAARFTYAINTLFAQDTWDVTRDLTLNYGLRYDFYTSDDAPRANPYFLARNGFSNTETYDGRSVLMPRFSFNYTPDTWYSVSGGVGLVSGGAPDVFLSNSFSNTGVLTAGVDIRRTGATTCIENNSSLVLTPAQCAVLLNVDRTNPNLFYDIPSGTVGGSAFSAQTLVTQFDPLNPANAGSALANAQTVNALHPDFEIPADWKANVAFNADLLGLRWGLHLVATRSQTSVAFTDTRARLLVIPNPTGADATAGVVAGQQRTPDGRLRYDGLTMSTADRNTRGMAVTSAIGANRDIVAYNPDETSWSFVTAVSVGQEYDNGLNFQFAYARQEGEDYGGYAQFGTTASGFYGEQYTDRDPNRSTLGRSNGEIQDSFKLDLGWRGELIGELETRLTLFAEHRTGRPVNFLMVQPGGTGRSSIFGVNRSDNLLYVPDLGACSGATLACGLVTFDNATTRDAFVNLVNRYGLGQGIVEKGAANNPDITQVDLQLSQELPGLYPSHRARIQFDIQNVLNLLNDEWGIVEEFGDSRANGRVIDVACADAAGVAVATTNPVCSRYRYSNFNGTVWNSPQVNSNESRWVVQVGLRYEF